mmetsp:Transcript_5097/g.14922  ORF Transcript_5097/g.14922 Transcript_5097/m.14922 type:complete len:91 (-) Transcript_5097:778-1050(-)
MKVVVKQARAHRMLNTSRDVSHWLVPSSTPSSSRILIQAELFGSCPFDTVVTLMQDRDARRSNNRHLCSALPMMFHMKVKGHSSPRSTLQ